jgi:hypothetical protein
MYKWFENWDSLDSATMALQKKTMLSLAISTSNIVVFALQWVLKTKLFCDLKIGNVQV